MAKKGVVNQMRPLKTDGQLTGIWSNEGKSKIWMSQRRIWQDLARRKCMNKGIEVEGQLPFVLETQAPFWIQVLISGFCVAVPGCFKSNSPSLFGTKVLLDTCQPTPTSKQLKSGQHTPEYAHGLIVFPKCCPPLCSVFQTAR